MIFDTHAHYDDEKFDGDREELLNGLKSQGVIALVNVGASMKGAEDSVLLSHKYPFIHSAVGIHPDHAKELDENGFMHLRELCLDEKCVAVGEIGLDYYWDESPRDVQAYWFKRQLELARELNKPVIIHSRDACEDTLNILKEYGKNDNPGAVVHCFSYAKETAREYVKMGFYIGIGGVVTFKNGRKLQEVAAETDLNRILLETDCPYLAPEPHRGERNNSAYIKYVADKIAEIKNITAEEVLAVTEENARKFYGISDRS